MHPNPVFRTSDHAADIAFARERGFGVLAVGDGAGVPHLSHVPFLLSGDGTTAELHLVRSNPIARSVSDRAGARLAVSGPDGYVSPDWYGLHDQVPTWNYVAVHLTGTLERRPTDELLPMLDRLSETFEAQLAPKRPWTTAKMTEAARDKLLRAIVPYVLRVDAIDATWKLNQNKTPGARHGAADRIAAEGIGHELDALARLMTDPPAP